MRVIYEDGVAGRTVVDFRGQAVGEVAAAVIETDSWRVHALRVRLRRDVADEIGAPRGTFHAAVVDVPIADVQGVGDAVVLRRLIADVWRDTSAGEAQPPAPP